MTASEDLSTPRLMRRYMRQLRWLWNHQSWKGNDAWFEWPTSQRTKSSEFLSRQAAANYSHQLLEERGWAMTKPSKYAA